MNGSDTGVPAVHVAGVAKVMVFVKSLIAAIFTGVLFPIKIESGVFRHSPPAQ